MIPFFCLNAYYSSRNKERALINDISAITVFGIAGLASSYLAEGTLQPASWLAFFASLSFFIGSTFYVKTMIREKKSGWYKRVSWGFHVLLVMLWMFLGQWVIAIASAPSLFRAFTFYGKPYSVKKVGILEIVNAVLFFVVMVVAL